MLTAKRLRKWLKYDPATGVFRWRANRHGRVEIGDVAGCIVQPKGHRVIGIDDGRYRANRLAWLYMTGKWPKLEINYINHNIRYPMGQPSGNDTVPTVQKST